jgi:hypothetical protein
MTQTPACSRGRQLPRLICRELLTFIRDHIVPLSDDIDALENLLLFCGEHP